MDKAVDLISDMLSKESRKLSTGSVLKSANNDYEDLYEVGKRLQKEIEKIEYLIDEGKITEFLERASKIMFGSGKDEQSRSTEEDEHSAIPERGTKN